MLPPYPLSKTPLELGHERTLGRDPSSVDAFGEIFFFISVEHRLIDGYRFAQQRARLSRQFDALGRDTLEARLVHVPGVGTLLYLDHLDFFQDLEAMAP